MRGGDGGSDGVSARTNVTSANAGTTDAEPRPPWRRAYVAVGSNLGDRYQNIVRALAALEADRPGTVRVRRTSYLRVTAPMYVTEQPSFLNGAVELDTTLAPLELLRAIKRVEGRLGRDVGPDSAAVRFGPRPVDLDILLFDGEATAVDEGGHEERPCALVMHTEELEIPHPRMAEREFVLSPLNDLDRKDGRLTHPLVNKTMTELLQSLRRPNGHRPSPEEDAPAVRVLPLPRGRMLLFNRTLIMGILNVTPDSFSDGGKFSTSAELAATRALQLEKDGADIIDVGGESTRPGAEEVAVEEELARVIPAILRIRQASDVPISIDTRHAAVARAAVAAGADVVNDVSGGTHDPAMLACVAALEVPLILMHMRGTPKTMQTLTQYEGEGEGEGGLVQGVARELRQRSAAAEAAGIPRWRQVVDPGIGFAKDAAGNLALLRGAETLRDSCGDLPFLFGPSRKGFIGKIAGETKPEERDAGTIAACLAALHTGNDETCTMLRVHNVKAVRQAVLVYEAIRDVDQ